MSSEIEVDESYSGGRRVKGLRGRGARGKTIVFGLFKRNGCVCTEIVPDCSKRTLQGIIRGRVELESVIHSDGWRGYDGLVDPGYQKHFPVEHGNNEFANEHSHINGIESFWAYAKTRLVKFRGLQKHSFYFHPQVPLWFETPAFRPTSPHPVLKDGLSYAGGSLEGDANPSQAQNAKP